MWWYRRHMIILSPFLAKLFNNCINQGTYPQSFKCAQVTPIHKSGPENVCTYYRPISVLSPLNKIFEKLLYDRLYHYVECKSMLWKHQYGFRAKVSTEFAIYDIVECILENLDHTNLCRFPWSLKSFWYCWPFCAALEVGTSLWHSGAPTTTFWKLFT